MDKLIYLAAQSAKATMQRQENIANNLANVSTPGFRAELMAFRSAPVIGEGGGTRTFSMESSVGVDTTPGQLQSTGRDLDVAVQGNGWLAVSSPAGDEAYTRAGALNVNELGNLVTSQGYQVMGQGGPINVPPEHRLSIGSDGLISAVPAAGGAPVELGQLKLVNPEKEQIVRSNDGLFRRKDGQDADVDPTVRVASGYLESSNVNAVEAMVQMISAAREFETQMKMISSSKENSQAANQLFGMN
jgi:flagellar basal-body rod protein FlgF